MVAFLDGLFSGAFAVSFRECKISTIYSRQKLFRNGSEVEAIAVADDVAESDADVTWCFTGKSAIKKQTHLQLVDLFDNDDSHD